MTTNGEIPRALIADAGPFIALFNVQDHDHDEAVRGLRLLADLRARLIVPLPVAFEVYKWLRYHVGGHAAREAIGRIWGTTRIEYPGPDEAEQAIRIARGLPTWGGSLEDALLAHMASSRRLHLWTFNYRDFAAFNSLRLWNPV